MNRSRRTMKLVAQNLALVSIFVTHTRSSYGFSLQLHVGGAFLSNNFRERKFRPSDTYIETSPTSSAHQNNDVPVCDDIVSFEDLGIDDALLDAILCRPDWLHPTPVQREAIPRLLEEIDASDAFWCEAPTGSGKTLAFLVPLIQNIVTRKKQQYQPQERERITSLILCPTRELCVQIHNVLEQIVDDMSDRRKITTMILHGGVPLTPQIEQLSDCVQYKNSIDVMVATPGRLIDVISRYSQQEGSSNAQDDAMERRLLQAIDNDPNDAVSLEQLQQLGLDNISYKDSHDDYDNDGEFLNDDGRSKLINILDGIQYLLLDEADKLLGNGFRDELDSLLGLVSTKPAATWLFSATLPKSIEPRLDQVLSSIGATNSPARLVCTNSDRKLSEDASVSSSLKRKLDRNSRLVSSATKYQQIGPASTINIRTIRLEKAARTQALRKLLEDDYANEWDRVLVFVSTRYASEHVSRKLRRVGIRSNELHGKLDQDARLRRLDDLKKGKIRVLLCTDVASRGIDISGLVGLSFFN